MPNRGSKPLARWPTRVLCLLFLATLIALMLAASLGHPSPARADPGWSALSSGMNGNVYAPAAAGIGGKPSEGLILPGDLQPML